MSTSSSAVLHRPSTPCSSKSDVLRSASEKVPTAPQSYMGSCWKWITHKAASCVPNVSEQTIWPLDLSARIHKFRADLLHFLVLKSGSCGFKD